MAGRAKEPRVEVYRALLGKVFGRPLGRGDALPAGRVTKAERRLGFTLPAAVRDFYRVAGRAKETCAHNYLLDPDQLAVEGRYLVFMGENQGVVDWGLRVSTLAAADPTVWQRTNGDRPKWYSERMPFSEFMLKNLAWQLGVELSDTGLERVKARGGRRSGRQETR